MARAVKSKASKNINQKVKKIQKKVIAIGIKASGAAAKKVGGTSLKLKAITINSGASMLQKAKSITGSKTLQAVKKTASQRLIETFDKRKQAAKAGMPMPKPPGRRGRRPKNVDYTPTNNEEEGFVAEPEYERLEHDTGIQMKGSAEDKGFSMDRMEDFDEELNFDW